MRKRITAGLLLLCFSIVVVPVATQAVTVDELRLQIAELLEKVSELQQQIHQIQSAERTGASQTAGSCPAVHRTLSVGVSGADVAQLQQFLARDVSVYPEGLVTGYYGRLTQAAVERWQVKHGIVSSGTPDTTGFGLVGPRTRASIGQQCESGGAKPIDAVLQVQPEGGSAPLTVVAEVRVNTGKSCEAAMYTLRFGDNSEPRNIFVPANYCNELTRHVTHVYQQPSIYTAMLSTGTQGTAVRVNVVGDTDAVAPEATACAADARICPDGSYVGRVAPSCEFAACPEETDTNDSNTCAMGARQCSDGTWVGRTGPNCEFVCPDMQVCPAVCVPMYEVQDDSCVYNSCGSGCGPDGTTSFENLSQCQDSVGEGDTSPEPEPEPQSRTFNVTGHEFSLSASELRVDQGDIVTINFTNLHGTHDFSVSGYGVKTDVLEAGQSQSITFTADQAGTFPFYCSVGSHRELGMEGALIVE